MNIPAFPADVMRLQARIAQLRYELAAERYGIAEAEAIALLHADGKSAEIRAAQVVVALSQNDDYLTTRHMADDIEKYIRELQAQIDAHDRVVKLREIALREAGK